MEFFKGLFPTEVIPGKWWKMPLVRDVRGLNKNKHDVLLIVGDSTHVIDDLREFIQMCPVEFDTMAMNYSAKVIPWDIQHFIAGDSHMEDMQKCANELPETCMKHCWNPKSAGFHYRWIRNAKTGWNGTTANLGIKIGIALGYTRIVLAGVPMDNSGNWYAPFLDKEDIKQGKDHRSHLWKWNEIAARPISRLIRSMSGNTADLLGKPTKDWILEAVNLGKENNHGSENESTN